MQPDETMNGATATETSQNDTTPTAPTETPIDMQPKGGDLRAAILAQTQELQEQTIYVPEWKVWVTVREMSSPARVALITATTDATGRRDGNKYYPLLTIASCFDPATKQPIFSAADKDTLNTGGGTAMERVTQIASRLSGLDADMFQQTKKA